MILGFIFTLIQRPELNQRTKKEISEKYKKMIIFPSGNVWSNTTKPDMCGLGTYDADNDFRTALSVLNYCRWLAGFSNTVVGNRNYINKQLQCAIHNNAIGDLSHRPNPGEPCYTKDAYNGCSNSNIAYTSYPSNSAKDVLMYFSDTGVDSVGHRRWCLYQGLKEVTFGRVYNYGAMRIMGFGYSDIETPTFFSWPAPGPFPIDFMEDDYWMFAWSFHLKSFKTNSPTIEIFEGNRKLTLDTSINMNVQSAWPYYHAVTFRPQDPIKADATYRVHIKDGADEYEYTVTPFDAKNYKPSTPKTPAPTPVSTPAFTPKSLPQTNNVKQHTVFRRFFLL